MQTTIFRAIPLVWLFAVACVEPNVPPGRETSTGLAIRDTVDTGPMPQKAAAASVACVAGDALACEVAGEACKQVNQFHKAVDFYNLGCAVAMSLPKEELNRRWVEYHRKQRSVRAAADAAVIAQDAEKAQALDEEATMYRNLYRQMSASLRNCMAAYHIIDGEWNNDDLAYNYAVSVCALRSDDEEDIGSIGLVKGMCDFKGQIEEHRAVVNQNRAAQAQRDAAFRAQMIQAVTQSVAEISSTAQQGASRGRFYPQSPSQSSLLQNYRKGPGADAPAGMGSGNCSSCATNSTYLSYRQQCGKTMAACYCGAAFLKKCCGEPTWSNDAQIASKLGTSCSLP